MKHFYLLYLIFTFLCVTVNAQPHKAEGLIQKGLKYQKQEKYGKSIRAFEKAMKKSDNSIIYYHHALSCFKSNKIEKAYASVVISISQNPIHANSHLLLSKIMVEKKSRLKVLLSLYFFLMLEPNSERANEEYQKLLYYIDHIFSDTPDKLINYSIEMDKNDLHFLTSEMFMNTYRQEMGVTKNQGLTDMEKLIDFSNMFFDRLWKMKGDNYGFWWYFYVPFFHEVQKNNFLIPFSHHISLSKGEETIVWVENNNEEYQKFINWLNNHKMLKK